MRRDYGYSVHVQHAGCWSLSTATIVVKVASGTFGMLTNIASTTADMLDSVIRNNTYKVIMTGLFPTCQVGLAALSVILLLTFSGRVRRRIVRRRSVGD